MAVVRFTNADTGVSEVRVFDNVGDIVEALFKHIYEPKAGQVGQVPQDVGSIGNLAPKPDHDAKVAASYGISQANEQYNALKNNVLASLQGEQAGFATANLYPDPINESTPKLEDEPTDPLIAELEDAIFKLEREKLALEHAYTLLRDTILSHQSSAANHIHELLPYLEDTAKHILERA